MYEIVEMLGVLMVGQYSRAIDRTAFCCLGGWLTLLLVAVVGLFGAYMARRKEKEATEIELAELLEALTLEEEGSDAGA